MESIFFHLNKADCKEMTSSVDKDGLLIITVPKDSSDVDINNFFRNLMSEQYEDILYTQNKKKEAFRKKVKKMIDKYAKEFDLPFCINLRLHAKTKKLNECYVDIHGIMFEGHMMLLPALQYFPDEMVDKIVRCTVYMIALDYEQRYSEIESFSVNDFDIMTGEEKCISKTKIPEEEKYRITIKPDVIDEIKKDYEFACKQFFDGMKKKPIGHT